MLMDEKQCIRPGFLNLLVLEPVRAIFAELGVGKIKKTPNSYFIFLSQALRQWFPTLDGPQSNFRKSKLSPHPTKC